MRGEVTSATDTKTKYGKEVLALRKQAEESLLEGESKEPPKPTVTLKPPERKLFKSYIANYPQLNIKHSHTVTTLVQYISEHNAILKSIRDLEVDDEERPALEKRALAFQKEINALTKEINNIRSQLFREAIEMAKLATEKQKAENMNKPKEEVDPGLALFLKTMGGNKK